MTAAPAYTAFISYSHVDAAVARRLQSALETYRVPRELVAAGLPARLYPVFRDRSDMRVGGDLGDSIEAALLASRSLIVICSPAAAVSPYVELELRSFRAAHPDRAVLPVIASGRPESDGGCFPQPLLADGAQPLAADLRPGGDGWRTTRLKLIAGILGVDVTLLARRDEQRRVRRLRLFAGLALAGMLVLGALLAQAIVARREADRQRAAAEDLVEFMVGDLRRQLEPVGRLSVLDALGAKALGYYREQDLAGLAPASLARRARVLRMIGEIETQQGKLDAAGRTFRAAADTTGKLLARAPNDGERVFDHAQNVFFIGNVAYQQRRLDEAQAAFDEYRRLAERLVALDPKHADWRAEIGYANSNLGTVLLDRGRNAEAERAFRRALAVSEAIARAAPTNADLQADLAQSHAWLADALSHQGRLRDALAQLEAEAAIYRALSTRGRNPRYTYMTANSDVARAVVLVDLGEIDLAEQSINDALRLARSLGARDATNVEWATIRLTAELTHLAIVKADQSPNSLDTQLSALLDALPPAMRGGRGAKMLSARARLLVSIRANDVGEARLALQAGDLALAWTDLVKPDNAWDVTLVRNQARFEIVRALVKLGRRKDADLMAETLVANAKSFSVDDWKLRRLYLRAEAMRRRYRGE